MDLKSGYPFWAVKNGLMCTFPQLKADIRGDVVVVGGGITGALTPIAWLPSCYFGWQSAAAWYSIAR